MQEAPGWIDTRRIEGNLQSLLPLIIRIVSETGWEPYWNELVARYHYLGYRNLLGRRLKYLVWSEERPVAALSWSAAAVKLRARDCFIGWSPEQRKQFLPQVVNNSRFLILPWVRIPHLASYVLARTIRQLSGDWQERFGQCPWLLETYVDGRRFKGTSYKAANWIAIGHTSGFSKRGTTYVYHGNRKEIFVYVLNPHFRKEIGCCQQPLSRSHRSFDPQREAETLQMILRDPDWHPDLIPSMDLTEDDLEQIAEELNQFHQEFYTSFGRREHRKLGLAYLTGLLSNSEAKSVEPIALHVLNAESVRSLQRFMKTYQWDHQAMEALHQAKLAELIASPEGMINVDSSEIAKKGKESVGVARQYCGSAGKVENCQSGVFVGYASDKGYGLLTAQLYMPERWFDDEHKQRRVDNRVPEDLTFQTKPQIAQQLIQEIVQSGRFPGKWIGCDATFGADSDFLHSLPHGYYYFANIRCNAKVFLEKPEVGIPPYQGQGAPPKRPQVLPGQPQAVRVEQLAQSSTLRWTPTVLAEGAKGPIIADIARLRVYPSQDGLPEETPVWLFFRRHQDGQIKYAISNAPENMPLAELAQAAVMRWPIEQCFQEGKSQLGMDHYEHRSWPAWHRHMIYVFLALHFLLRLRIRYKKKLQRSRCLKPVN
jgi:SRSO17 transposase